MTQTRLSALAMSIFLSFFVSPYILMLKAKHGSETGKPMVETGPGTSSYPSMRRVRPVASGPSRNTTMELPSPYYKATALDVSTAGMMVEGGHV
ncbi:hypothetical protein CFD26_101100 [Aspergillus turcosus]|uniref:Uncharacterized protein n=1 Tax=Aspergillus turcosus TaxID=1245748 RepID=A0A421D1V4_9EURO|nr:hypothetical protein CFD26_101100 [Aspergillus turcosus]